MLLPLSLKALTSRIRVSQIFLTLTNFIEKKTSITMISNEYLMKYIL